MTMHISIQNAWCSYYLGPLETVSHYSPHYSLSLYGQLLLLPHYLLVPRAGWNTLPRLLKAHCTQYHRFHSILEPSISCHFIKLSKNRTTLIYIQSDNSGLFFNLPNQVLRKGIHMTQLNSPQYSQFLIRDPCLGNKGGNDAKGTSREHVSNVIVWTLNQLYDGTNVYNIFQNFRKNSQFH